MGLGAAVFAGTLAAWYWGSGFGCGMNPTGCSGFSLPMPWEDPELFRVLGPFLLLGLVLIVLGKWGVRA